MYNLTEDQIVSVETFIGKIPESLIKSRYEKWLAEIAPTMRITSEQMLQFTDYATHLPNELQSFPQSFLHTVKNTPHTEDIEELENTKQTADLTDLLDESISNVKDVDAPKNEEETLHKLGVKKTAKDTKAARDKNKSTAKNKK